ncbi:MAG: DUF1573 domain-containing protein [Flavobacteriales bacterium]
MKKLLLLCFILPFFLSCGNEELNDDNFTDLIDIDNPAVIELEETEYNFGTIIEGAVVTHRFVFTNTGNTPLLIAKVDATCGCTASKDYTRKPILKGEKGYIDAVFSSEGFPGNSDKTLTIVANTFPTNTIIKLKGKVVGPDKFY